MQNSAPPKGLDRGSFAAEETGPFLDEHELEQMTIPLFSHDRDPGGL